MQKTYTPYTVAYIINSGTGVFPADETLYKQGSVITVLFSPLPVKEWLVFGGWNTKADGTGDTYSETGINNFIIGNGDIVLYAKWIPMQLW